MRHRLELSSAEGRTTAKGAELLVKWSPKTGCQYQVVSSAGVSIKRWCHTGPGVKFKNFLFFALKKNFFFDAC